MGESLRYAALRCAAQRWFDGPRVGLSEDVTKLLRKCYQVADFLECCEFRLYKGRDASFFFFFGCWY
jgi:hypothetical protein